MTNTSYAVHSEGLPPYCNINCHLTIGMDTTLVCDTPGARYSRPHGDDDPRARIRPARARQQLHRRQGAGARFRNTRDQTRNSVSTHDAGGQDGAAAQQAASGARAICIVVGTRYIHTVTEMIDKDDLQAALDILVAYLAEY